MVKSRSTWTSDRSASRTLSLLITGLLGVGLGIGLRDRGGLGGGKCWKTGVPYWFGSIRGWWTAALGGTDESIGELISEDEELDARKVEGLTSLVTWLPMLIVWREADEAEWEADGICTAGAGENKPLGTVEVTVAEW